MIRSLAAFLTAALIPSAGLAEGTRAVFERYCFECHDALSEDGDFNFEAFLEDGADDAETLGVLRLVIAEADMPPRRADQPSADERAAMMAWVETQLAANVDTPPNDPGPVVMPRLDWAQYHYAVRDLTGHEISLDQFIPRDAPAGEGFSNVGSAHEMNVMRLEKYLRAADHVLSHARVSPGSGIVWSPILLREVQYPANVREELIGDIALLHQDEETRLFEFDGGGRRRSVGSAAQVALYLDAARALRHGQELPQGAHPRIAKAFSEKIEAAPDKAEELLGPWKALGADAADEEVTRELAGTLVELGHPRKKHPLAGFANELLRGRSYFRKEVAGKHVARLFLSDFPEPGVVELLDASHFPEIDEEDRAELFAAEQTFALPPAELRALMSPDARGRLARLEEDLLFASQLPWQRLRKFAAGQGLEPPVEGRMLEEGELAKLNGGARREHDRIVAEVAVFENDLAARARAAIAGFVRHAWHREAGEAELDALLALYREQRREGAIYDVAVKQALRAVMIDPEFLYRFDPWTGEEGVQALSPRALAQRLSFFLWSTGPDQRLGEFAASGEILHPEVLAAEARRMLADPRARALSEQFAGQWFGVAGFRESRVLDETKFPEFDDELRAAMLGEVLAFFDAMFRENRPVTDLVESRTGFLNERLAAHYGVEGVTGSELREVELPASQRGGILGMGAILVNTSMALRTSPVVRGHWVVENVLGHRSPPPPANVAPISEDETNAAGQSIVEQLAAHRADPACAACHDRIDPPGMALENFDPLGRWRDAYESGAVVENAATLRDGGTLAGFDGLREWLRGQQDDYVRQFCRKLLGFALGRSVLLSDEPLLDQMTRDLEADGFRVATAVEAVVTSRQFTHRRGAPQPQQP